MLIIDPSKLKLVVSIALIDRDDKILITKRPPNKHLSDYWEFPGGKVEKHEKPEQAIVREVKEELNIDISNQCVAPLSFSEFGYNTFHLLLLLYVCRKWEGELQSMENNEIKWVKPNMLRKFKMPPADDSLIYALQDLFYN